MRANISDCAVQGATAMQARNALMQELQQEAGNTQGNKLPNVARGRADTASEDPVGLLPDAPFAVANTEEQPGEAEEAAGLPGNRPSGAPAPHLFVAMHACICALCAVRTPALNLFPS